MIFSVFIPLLDSQCNAIDTKSNCYLMEPACQSSVHDEVTIQHDYIAKVIIFIMLAVMLVSVLMYKLILKKLCKGKIFFFILAIFTC